MARNLGGHLRDVETRNFLAGGRGSSCFYSPSFEQLVTMTALMMLQTPIRMVQEGDKFSMSIQTGLIHQNSTIL